MLFKKSLDYFKFCPVCGHRLGVSKVHGQKLLNCPACHFVFYQNSKPTVAVFFLNSKGQLLLVKRAVQPKFGLWDLPGGFLEEGEDPIAGVRREIKEELGVTIKQIELMGLYPDSYGYGYKIFCLNIIYKARIASGKIKAMDDVGSVQWFFPKDIPWSRLAFPGWMKPALYDWLKHK